MPAITTGSFLLLAVAIDSLASSASSWNHCGAQASISTNGDYSDVEFFVCHSHGNDLNITWIFPENFSDEAQLQVEYQCYNESLVGNSTVVSYENNLVIKSFDDFQEISTTMVTMTNSSCLVIGCYETVSFRWNVKNVYWLKKADCIPTILPSSSVGPMPSLLSEEQPLPSGDSAVSLSKQATTTSTTITFTQTSTTGFGISIEELLVISVSSVVVLLVAMVTIVLVSWWICRKMKHRKRLELKGAEAEIVRIDIGKLQNQKFLSLSLGKTDVVQTPYSSLEKIDLCTVEVPSQRDANAGEKDVKSVVADEVCEPSHDEVVLDSSSSESTESSSVTDSEGRTNQGLSSQQYVPRLTPMDLLPPVEKASVLCGKRTHSQDSLNHLSVVSEYIVVREQSTNDVFNQV